MRARKNRYKDYKGDIHEYIMYSDYDTPEKRAQKSKQEAFRKCGLTTCVNYKTCDLKQQSNEKEKCINYKHFYFETRRI
jgi:hypothetical protein